jgi:predicted PurR-regulated permease PerM
MSPNESNLEGPSIFKPVLILTGAAILLTVMHLAASFLMPIMMGVFLAVLLTPIYRWFKRRKIPGGLPLLLSIGVLVVVVIFFMMLIGNAFTTLASDLAVYGEQFAEQQAKLEATASNLTLKELISRLDPANMVNILSFILGAAREFIGQGILILLITTFVLAEAPQFKKRIVKAYGADHFMTRNLIGLAGSIISYFGLRALVNLVVAVATGIMLWLFGIPHAGLWAVMTFFLSFVPYIGAVIAMIPPIMLAYAMGGPTLAAIIIVLAMVINALSENIVAPMVMGKGLSVSPTVVFLSFIFWMFILGGSGALIAMPLTVGLMLFMSSFAETRGLAAIMGSTPTSE